MQQAGVKGVKLAKHLDFMKVISALTPEGDISLQ
jgi:hypothetical protein